MKEYLINFVDCRRRSLQKLKRAWFLLACTKILPRRRGIGSDEVADEGVETSGKAESRKKKAEIAKRIIACYYFVNSLRISHSTNARPSSKRDNYIAYTKSLQNAYSCNPHATRENYIALLTHRAFITITKKGLSL